MSGKRSPRLTFYRARDGWRWRMRASNGRIVASSSEAFASQRNARKNAERCWHQLGQALWPGSWSVTIGNVG